MQFFEREFNLTSEFVSEVKQAENKLTQSGIECRSNVDSIMPQEIIQTISIETKRKFSTLHSSWKE